MSRTYEDTIEILDLDTLLEEDVPGPDPDTEEDAAPETEEDAALETKEDAAAPVTENADPGETPDSGTDSASDSEEILEELDISESAADSAVSESAVSESTADSVVSEFSLSESAEDAAVSETPDLESADSKSADSEPEEAAEISEEMPEGTSEETPEETPEEIPAEQKPIMPMFSDPEPAAEAAPAKKSRMGWAVAALLLVLTGGAYVHGVRYYQEHFLPGSYIMGQDVGDMTAEEAVDRLEEVREVPSFELAGREGVKDALDLNSIGLERSYQGIPEAIRTQKSGLWIFWRRVGKEIPVSFADSYDEEALGTALRSLPQFSESAQKLPTDAYVQFDGEQDRYIIVPETEGSTLHEDMVQQLVGERILRGEMQLDLNEHPECYEEPQLRQDAAELVSHAGELNLLHSLKAGVDLGADTRAELSGEQLLELIQKPEMTEAYVTGLADQYDTYAKGRQERFVTHDGRVLYIENNYGWQMDREATLEALNKMVETAGSRLAEGTPEVPAAESAGQESSAEAPDSTAEGEDGEDTGSLWVIPAVWKKQAASHGRYDYGTTYCEADLGAQTVYVYQDGQCVLTSPCVSGRMTKGRITPGGIYDIKYKQTNKVLRGFKADGSLDYASPVSYWMPFNGGIGFHDATWRGSFGGSIYVNSGSHGCVNLPLSRAREMYSLVYKGMPVIVYYG